MHITQSRSENGWTGVSSNLPVIWISNAYFAASWFFGIAHPNYRLLGRATRGAKTANYCCCSSQCPYTAEARCSIAGQFLHDKLTLDQHRAQISRGKSRGGGWGGTPCHQNAEWFLLCLARWAHFFVLWVPQSGPSMIGFASWRFLTWN